MGLALALAAALVQAVLGSPSGAFWVVTDWHLNNGFNATPPRQDAALASTQRQCLTATSVPSLRPGTYGGFGCDSNLALFEATLEHMVATLPDPDFILWQGDNFGHVAPPDTEELVLGATQLLGGMLARAFPGVPVLPAVGNHDTWPYNSDPGPAFYAKLCGLWSRWLQGGAGAKRGNSSDSAMATCAQGGYFELLLQPGLRALSLNSQHQSVEMLAWARGVLETAAAAGEKVYIVTHIPPGPASCYSCACGNGFSGGCWGTDAAQTLHDLVVTYADTVVALFAGHTHSDEFRIFGKNMNASSGSFVPLVPMYISNSLPPYNPSTNPAVRSFTYVPAASSSIPGTGADREDSRSFATLLDFKQWWLDLEAANRDAASDDPLGPSRYWHSYSARARYGLPDLSARSWANLAARFDTDDDLFQAYFQASSAFPAIFDNSNMCTDEWSASVYSPQGGGGRCKSAFICPMLHVLDDDYNACIAARNATAVDDVDPTRSAASTPSSLPSSSWTCASPKQKQGWWPE